MAATPVPVTTITPAGVAQPAATVGDTANGHSVVNDGRTWLEVTNADAANPHTVTVGFARTVDGQAVTAKVWSIPASATARRIRLGNTDDYGPVVGFTVDSAQLSFRAFNLA